MPSSSTLVIEKALAGAHRSIASARDMASTYSDLGLHDDLQLMLLYIETLQVDLLRSSKPRRVDLQR